MKFVVSSASLRGGSDEEGSSSTIRSETRFQEHSSRKRNEEGEIEG